MMMRFLLLSIFIWSCSQHKQSQAPDNSLSIIMASDTVIIYSGKLKKNTEHQEIAIDEIFLKAALAKKRTNDGKEPIVLLKLSSGLIKDGFMRQIMDMRNWLIESGFTDIQFAEMDEMDTDVFELIPVSWASVDSFNSPKKLDLMMPKDVSDESRPIDEENAFTMILLSEEANWAYTGTDYQRGQLYSMGELRQLLIEKKKELGDSLVVIIKPAEAANYKATVNALDLMTTQHIKRYALVKLSKEEEIFLNSPHEFEPPEPVETKIPNSVSAVELPDDNALLIDLRKDGTVWYQVISKTAKIAPQKVNAPVTKNLTQIIADFANSLPNVEKKYLVRGDGNTSYKRIEQVTNAFKANNILKYNLVTSLE